MRSFNLTHPDVFDGEYADTVILRCIAGSRAYGTATPGSDTDIRGVFILPRWCYLSVSETIKQVADERNDRVFFALGRFLELASTANPNIVELLFMPEDCILEKTVLGERLIAMRDVFLSKRAYDTHVGYAQAQVKRARGRNKWVNNPQPEDPPSREGFCRVIPREGTKTARSPHPFRPIPLAETGIRLEECHCAKLEYCVGVFRLYHYGPGAKGVFRDGNLVCESIPFADEDARCIGLLLYDQSAFEKALRDYNHYWEWRRHRNEARWKSQERGESDYDAKNMMHTFRLLLSGEQLLREGRPLVRFTGERLAFLKDCLAGRYRYEELIRMAEEKTAELKELRDRSNLPDEADVSRIDALLHELTEEWERNHER